MSRKITIRVLKVFQQGIVILILASTSLIIIGLVQNVGGVAHWSIKLILALTLHTHVGSVKCKDIYEKCAVLEMVHYN